MSPERLTNHTSPEASPKAWVDRYAADLSLRGWKFLSPQDGLSSRLVAYQDSATSELMEKWRGTKEGIELSIVAVMPNDEDISRLPARTLGYAVTALSFVESARKSGVNVDTLRILSPCRVNAFCNGGDETGQIKNVEAFRNLVQTFAESYMPHLSDLDITLDLGKPIDSETVPILDSKARQIAHENPQLTQNLVEIAQRYRRDDINGGPIDPDLLPNVYLWAHPKAWGYGEEEVLFARNGERRINFMPASELRYLQAMMEIQSTWTRSTNKEIATVISAKQTHAPYIPLPQNDPSLGDLAAYPVQVVVDKLRPLVGRAEVAEVVAGLNQIKSALEQAKNNRRRIGLTDLAPTLSQVLEGALKTKEHE